MIAPEMTSGTDRQAARSALAADRHSRHGWLQGKAACRTAPAGAAHDSVQTPANPCPALAGGLRREPSGMRDDSSMGGIRRLLAVAQIHNLRLRALIAGSVLVLLTACNAMKLGYQQGDHLAYWWVDNYVDVTDNQEPQTKDAIARFFAWHRRSQLPEIEALLQEAKTQVQQPVSQAQVDRFRDESMRLTRLSYDHAIPDVADLLLTLDAEQIQRMERKFADGNEKYRKKFLRGDQQDRLDARFDKVMEWSRLVYGRFSKEQEDTIRKALAPVVDNAESRYAERLKRQQAWLALVRQVQAEKPPKARVIELLQRFGDQWQAPPTRERRVNYEAASETGLSVAVTIANLTTPEQKRHAVDRFQGWINDVQELRRETPRKAPTQPAHAAN
ncbi:DUF6279 family lipoprotein [Paracidovorax citrulli]